MKQLGIVSCTPWWEACPLVTYLKHQIGYLPQTSKLLEGYTFIHLVGVMSGHCESKQASPEQNALILSRTHQWPLPPHPLELESKTLTFSPQIYWEAALLSLTPLNFILCLHNHCFTLASIFGGKGRPVITTARPFISAKSSPSLTYTNVKNKYVTK